MIIAAFDTETTSKEDSRSIVELGVVKWNSEDNLLTDVQVFNERFKPKEMITYGAMGVHHITNEEVEGCRNIEDAEAELSDFFQDVDLLIAHNLPFDLEVFEREVVLGPYSGDTMDTLRLARHTWDNLPDYKLSSLRYRFDLVMDSHRHMNNGQLDIPACIEGGQHSAAFDAYLCLPLADICRKMLKLHWEELAEKAASPLMVKLMYFGKHRGMEVSEMVLKERGYVEWLLKQSWFAVEHPDLRWTILQLLR
jgi:DNA polymerase III epsilon subunit-like protein